MEKKGWDCLTHGLEHHALTSSKLAVKNKDHSHHNRAEFAELKWPPVAGSNCCAVWAAANTACLSLAGWS